jgi:hypothetical protein
MDIDLKFVNLMYIWQHSVEKLFTNVWRSFHGRVKVLSQHAILWKDLKGGNEVMTLK